MSRNESIDFIIILLKCFLILLFFGILLPQIFEILLNHINLNLDYKNAKFVNFDMGEKRSVMDNYLNLFYSLLKLK